MKVDICRRHGRGKVFKFHRRTVHLPFKQTTQILTKKTKDKRKPNVVISLM